MPQKMQHICKEFDVATHNAIQVEIGGDGQSTDGTEASHMHYRDDLNCDRG